MIRSTFRKVRTAAALGALCSAAAAPSLASAQPEAPPPEEPFAEPSSPEPGYEEADTPASGAEDLLPDAPESAEATPVEGARGASAASTHGSAATATGPSSAAPSDAARDKRKDKKLGPVEVEISDGNSVGIGFAGQIRTTITEKDNGLAKPRETVAEIAVRRLRFILNGSFFEKKLKTSAQLNFVPGQIELLDLYANYEFMDELQVQLGEFKIPFTRYRWQSFQRLLFTDWSLVTQHFGSERQMGAMVHNGQKDATDFSYAFGVFTGTNTRASFEKGLAASYGESLPNPSDLTDPALPEEMHPELVLRLAHNAKNIDAETNSDWRGGPVRHSVGVSAAWDAQPVATRDFHLRLSPELLVKWQGLSANAVGYFGFFQDSQADTQFGSWGINTEVGWRITELAELALRFAHVDQLDALRNDAKRRASAIIATASEDDVADVRKQYSSAGKVDNEQEMGLGLNLYFHGNSVKWQQDVCLLRKELDSDVRHDARARMQLQVAF